MKAITRVYLCLLLLPLLIAGVNAVAYKGYSGTTFNATNNAYTIIGADPILRYNNDTDNTEQYYRRILIQSKNDETIQLSNGTCRSTHKYTYCYTGSSIDTTNPQTYTGDYLRPILTITVEPINYDTMLSVDRQKRFDAYCGQDVIIPILFINNGIETNVTYTEILPPNTLIAGTIGGVVDNNKIAFHPVLGANTQKNYSYTVQVLDCQGKQWNAVYTYTTINSTLTKSINDLRIGINPSYTISAEAINETNSLGMLEYTLNIKNINPYSSVQVMLECKLINATTNNNKYARSIERNTTYAMTLDIRPDKYGTILIICNGTLAIGAHYEYYNKSAIIQVLKPELSAKISINTTNNGTMVSLIVGNNDLKETYYNIYGTLTGKNISADISYANITPRSIKTVYSKTYANITGSMVFKGIYRNSYGEERLLNAVYDTDTATATAQLMINQGTNPAINPAANPIINTSADISGSNSSNNPINKSVDKIKSEPEVQEKDFITSILGSISDFLQALFR